MSNQALLTQTKNDLLVAKYKSQYSDFYKAPSLYKIVSLATLQKGEYVILLDLVVKDKLDI